MSSGTIIPSRPQMMKLEPPTAKERRDFAILQAVVTLLGGGGSYDGAYDVVDDVQKLLKYIETGEAPESSIDGV